MGAQLVREVANKTSDLTGDGTTTATLLAQAIVREGMRALDEGANPMLLRRGIEEATARIVERAPADRAAGRGPRAARAHRDDRRQGGRDHRQGDRGRARPGRGRGRRDRRGVRDARDHGRLRRGRERRQRLDLAVHDRGPDADGDGPRGPLHPHDGRADHAPAGPHADARRGHEVAAPAGHPGREGRRPGARDDRDEQPAPHAGRRRGPRPGVRSPPHPPPRRPGGLHRRPGDRRGGRSDARRAFARSSLGRARRVVVTADSTTFVEGAGSREAVDGRLSRDPRRARARD